MSENNTEKKVEKPGKPLDASKSTKALPTERASFQKQLDLLRGFAAASGPTFKPVTNKDVSKIVKIHYSTVSNANAFFVDVGFISRVEGGFAPHEVLVNFLRAHEWAPENAPRKLAPLIERTWFGKTILERVAFGVLQEKEAIQTLGEEASAGRKYHAQLRLLLDYLEASGLVEREGGWVKKASAIPTVTSSTKTAEPSTKTKSTQAQEPKEEVTPRPAVTTTIPHPTEGVVQFHIGVRVDMKEFADWPPERITAFFSGIAQVLAAKGGTERDEG